MKSEKTPPAAQAEVQTRGNRKVRTGIVVSNKMQKTIVVKVERHAQHSTYRRVLNPSTSFKAHDETNEAKPGDVVRIMETRPLSKDKRWRLVEILKRASTAPELPDSEPAKREKSSPRVES